MFRTGLKGFFSILFGIIVIGALVVGGMYVAGYISFSSDSEQESTCEAENCIGGEGNTNDADSAIQIGGDYIYLYNIN